MKLSLPNRHPYPAVDAEGGSRSNLLLKRPEFGSDFQSQGRTSDCFSGQRTPGTLGARLDGKRHTGPPGWGGWEPAASRSPDLLTQRLSEPPGDLYLICGRLSLSYLLSKL